ncbi:hypothetical protein [Intrasporangium sp. DVR]|uniref:hypothetical protein n=1 Tax=Intrasporangium sp. DVR TaxID=3127867 RepID=UPI00313A72D6
MNANEHDRTDRTEPVDTPIVGGMDAPSDESADTQHIEHGATERIETTGTAMTQQDPTTQAAAPFKVEPATPVPDDVVRDDAAAASLPHLETPPPAPTAPHWSRPPARGLVTVRRGPLPVTIMLGLLSLIVAGYVMVTNLAGAQLDMRVMGPMVFGSFGGLLLLVGLIGVIAGGRRGPD